MYKVYHNGVLIPNVASVRVEAYHSGISRFEAVVANPDSSWRNTLSVDNGCGYKDQFRIEIFRGSENVLGTNRGFFLLNVERKGRNLKLSGLSYEVLLLNEKAYPEKNFEKINLTDIQIIDALIADFSTTISSTSHGGTGIAIPSFRAENQTLADRLEAIRKVTGREWYVERQAANTFVLVTDNPVTWGTTYSAPNPTPLKLYEDIGISSYLSGVKDVVNEVTVVGTGDGKDNQVRITMPNERGCTGETDTVNRTCNPPVSGCTGVAGNYLCNHANAVSSQGKFGRVTSEPFIDRSINTVEEAIEVGKKILDERCGYDGNTATFTGWERITPRVRYISQIYKTGEWIKVIDNNTGIERIGRVQEVVYSFNRNGENVRFNIVNGEIDALIKVKRETLSGNTSGIGATNIYAVSHAGNTGRNAAGTLIPLKVKFRIPDDVKRINKVLLTWDVSPFRIYTDQLPTYTNPTLTGSVSSGGQHNVLAHNTPQDVSGLNSIGTTWTDITSVSLSFGSQQDIIISVAIYNAVTIRSTSTIHIRGRLVTSSGAVLYYPLNNSADTTQYVRKIQSDTYGLFHLRIPASDVYYISGGTLYIQGYCEEGTFPLYYQVNCTEYGVHGHDDSFALSGGGGGANAGVDEITETYDHVHIRINGVDVETAGALSSTDYDVSQYITTSGWHTIELWVEDAGNAVQNAWMNVGAYIKCYVESK